MWWLWIMLFFCFLPINNNSSSSRHHRHKFVWICVCVRYLEKVSYFEREILTCIYLRLLHYRHVQPYFPLYPLSPMCPNPTICFRCTEPYEVWIVAGSNLELIGWDVHEWWCHQMVQFNWKYYKLYEEIVIVGGHQYSLREMMLESAMGTVVLHQWFAYIRWFYDLL